MAMALKKIEVGIAFAIWLGLGGTDLHNRNGLVL
jgi:multidrug transporter EmrE-like cation transporter